MRCYRPRLATACLSVSKRELSGDVDVVGDTAG